ncbi:MAG: hypothetical protein [Bacteriophage sp.]|nr:MAG: hypothetical protein [Bacteriophage sp.]
MKPSYRIAELEKSLELFRQRAFAAEQERDALKSTEKRVVRLANSNSDLWEEMANRLEAAERERDIALSSFCNERLRGDNLDRESQRLSDQLGTCDRERREWIKRAEKAEAEIARRDAAASEPADRIVDDGCGQQIGGVGVSDQLNCVWPIGTKFYTAAPPAVLPPEMKPEPEKYDVIDHGFIAGYNKCRSDALALGAQPQNPVVLPEPHAHLIWIQAGRGPDDYWDDVEVSRSEEDRCCDGSERYAVYSEFEVKAMLESANIPYEVNK